MRYGAPGRLVAQVPLSAAARLLAEIRFLGGRGWERPVGKLRIEGKDYEVADGDTMEIRFNV